MNKEQQELLDEAYKNYQTEWLKENPPFSGPYTNKCLTQEEFINKIKTDTEFSRKWGLNIEERELSSQERKNIYDNSSWEKDMFPTDINGWNKLFDGYNIPTRLITITYNNKTIESYE
jgi:hypothetical protein